LKKILDDERKENTRALNSSLLMLTECITGFNMSMKDIEYYAKDAGFRSAENLRNKVGCDVAICYK